MRILNCNTSSSLLTLPSPSPPSHKKPSILQTINKKHNLSTITWTKKALINVLSGVLSFNLLLSSPSSFALESPSVQSSSPASPLTESCLEADEVEAVAQSESGVVSNEGIVEEAWQIVNDSFLDTGRRRWTPQNWQVNII